MHTTPEHNAKFAVMTFASVYPHYVAKVVRKGRTESELLQVIEWLTGFDEKKVRELIASKVNFERFFAQATLNPNAHLIKGSICGYKIEELQNSLNETVKELRKLEESVPSGLKNLTNGRVNGMRIGLSNSQKLLQQLKDKIRQYKKSLYSQPIQEKK